ncbi:MAG: lycopene cyclase domain-containing protein [bacterium]|nr:lycopene cyclase domain-containing protein [bacterium]
MKKYYYLISLVFVFIIPAGIASYFVFDRIPFVNLIIFVGSITLLGGIWDIWATRHGKRDPVWLWQFNFKDTLGIKLFDLPIEEYIFYVASSLYIVFIWEGIKLILETKDLLMIVTLPFLGLWSLLTILIPYARRAKNDKLQP